MGGLSKKAHLIKELSNQGRPTLVVESGNLLFKTDVVPPNELAAARVGAEAMVQALQRMGVTFAGIGSRDLAGSIPFLQGLHRPPAFAWLSLNLVDPASGQPLFTPLLRRQAGAVRLVVLAVTDHALFARPPAGAVVLPWRQVLPQAVARVAGGAEFILLLSNYAYAENREIARACPDIDLILQSGHVGGNMSPIPFDRTLLTQTDTRGRHLGVLDLDWPGHGPWHESSAGGNSLSGQDQAPAFRNRFIALTPSLPDDPAIEALVRQASHRMDQLKH